MSSFPFFSQHDSIDCGAACLRMVAQYYGRHYTLESLRQKCHISREGVSMLGISEAAEGIGFKTVGVHLSFGQLKSEAPLSYVFFVTYRLLTKYNFIRKKNRKNT